MKGWKMIETFGFAFAFCVLLALWFSLENQPAVKARKVLKGIFFPIPRFFKACIIILVIAISVAIGVAIGVAIRVLLFAGKLAIAIESKMRYRNAALKAIGYISLTLTSLGAVGILLPEASQATKDAAESAFIYGMIAYTITHTVKRILKILKRRARQ
jgi:hypothetical protein